MEFSALTARTGNEEFLTTADGVIAHLHQLYPEQACTSHGGADCHPRRSFCALALPRGGIL